MRPSFDYGHDLTAIPAKYQPFRFHGGCLALDFIDTVYNWRHDCIDRVSSPEQWRSWLVAVGLETPDEDITPAGFDQLWGLREEIFSIAQHIARDEPLRDSEPETMNRLAAIPAPSPRLAIAGSAPFRSYSRGYTHEDVLAKIAKDAIRVFAETPWERIKECLDHGCPTVFVDNSPAGIKRWCSAQCSARSSSRSYRHRAARSVAEPL